MALKRTDRLNSLLREVLSEVIRQDVKNPHIHELITVTQVDISRDLHNAKVYISVIGNDREKKGTLNALKSAAGYIAVIASKKVVMRYFPHLNFFLDDSVDKHQHIDDLIEKINGNKPLKTQEDETTR